MRWVAKKQKEKEWSDMVMQKMEKQKSSIRHVREMQSGRQEKSERRIFGIRRHHVCENKHENSSNINMNILQQGFKANL